MFGHIVAYLELCVTLAYSEPSHIQSLGIFRILAYLEPKIYSELCQGIFWHISDRFATLVYSEPCHIQNLIIFRILAYLGPEAYSGADLEPI